MPRVPYQNAGIFVTLLLSAVPFVSSPFWSGSISLRVRPCGEGAIYGMSRAHPGTERSLL